MSPLVQDYDLYADETFLPAPPMVNLLHAQQLPACGGDTAFISTRAAYAGLSDRMKTLLEGLRGEHDLAMTYEAGWRAGLPLRDKVAAELASGRASLHPVVMRHPANGLPWLNVSPTYTRFLQGLVCRTPLVAIPILISKINHDYTHWPFKEVHVYEEWRANTPWGQLFQEYQQHGHLA